MSAIGKTFRVSLDMKQPTAQRNEWEVVEGDNGNVIEITLTDDGSPVDLSGCKVLAVFGLPTGQTVEQDTDEGSVTIGGTDNNVITIALKTGSFSPGKAASGLMKCEIQVYSGVPQTTLVTSAQFTFRCRRAIMNDETIAATDDYPVLVELIEEVQQLIIDNQSDWAENDPTDPAYIKNKAAMINANLLDNWYFAGGGSQQGGGQFPVNQRGQTSYGANVYSIDRWRTDSNVSITVNSGNVKIANAHTSYSQGIYEILENPDQLLGEVVTGSILLSNGSFYYGTGKIPSSYPGSGSTNVDLFDIANITRMRISVQSSNRIITSLQAKPSTDIQIVAAKLELGPQQTLCYHDGTAWHLREIPNFTEQLLRCQRFQYVFNGAAYTPWATGMVWSSTTARFHVPLPVQMAKGTGTTSVINGTLTTSYVYSNRQYVTPSAVVGTAYGTAKGNADLEFTITGGTSYDPCVFSSSSQDLKILIDCNL